MPVICWSPPLPGFTGRTSSLVCIQPAAVPYHQKSTLLAIALEREGEKDRKFREFRKGRGIKPRESDRSRRIDEKEGDNRNPLKYNLPREATKKIDNFLAVIWERSYLLILFIIHHQQSLMIDLIYILKDLWRTRDLQKWVNNRFKDENMVIFPKNYLYSIETTDGLKFFLDDQYTAIIDSIKDYRIDLIHPDDIVLDVGANIGGFALRASLRSNHVYALEPIFIERLTRNIEANSKHIHVIKGALGGISGGKRVFSYFGYERSASIFTLTDLKAIAGGCDYLKCDCEGNEWEIRTEELIGIRHIEMELHRTGVNHNEKFTSLMTFLEERYAIELDLKPEYPELYGILHAELLDSNEIL